jgi:hypothetical protein
MASAQGAAGGESEKEKTLFQSKTNMKDDIKVLSVENDDGYRLTLILLKFHMLEGFIFKLCQILELMNLTLLFHLTVLLWVIT